MNYNEVKLFCSAGRGTEKFVEKELNAGYTSNLEVNKVADGKVFFSINQSEDIINSVLRLKTVERLFLELNCFKTSRLPYGKGKGQFMNALKRRLVKESRFLKAADIFQNFNYLYPANKNTVDRDEPVTKKLKLEYSDSKKSFRVSCKISGKFSKLSSAQELNIELGKYVSNLTGWNIDLKHPLFEISVHINDEMVVAGIPLTRQPLSKRDYILHSGLRSPVAWILGYLTQIQPGDIILDPMCGKSTILIEAVKCLQPNAVYYGIDRNHRQLKTAQANVKFAACQNNIHLLISNGLDLPFKSESVDKVICDAPFGEKHKIASDINQFYFKLLQETHRVLRHGGRFVLLTSSRLRPYVIILLKSFPEHLKKSEHLHVSDKHFLAEDGKSAKNNCKNTCCNSASVFDSNLTCVCDQSKETSILDANKTKNCDEVMNNMILECNMKIVTPGSEKVKCDVATISASDIFVTKVPNRDKNTCVEENEACMYDTMYDRTKPGDDKEKDEAPMEQGIENPKSIERNDGKSLDEEKKKLLFLEDHYMKLGETHAYIIVAKKK